MVVVKGRFHHWVHYLLTDLWEMTDGLQGESGLIHPSLLTGGILPRHLALFLAP